MFIFATVKYSFNAFVVDKRLDEWIGADRFIAPEQRVSIENLQGPLLSSMEGAERTVTRNLRRQFEESGRIRKPHDDPFLESLEKEHEEATKVKNIQKIELGSFEIDCWYFSPYPDEYANFVDRLYICEWCLKYMSDRTLYHRHYASCPYTGPPGRLIYLHNQLAVFEMDGEQHKLYCQNLSLMAKLFLDHKALYYDVGPFMFYALCELDDRGCHLAGYFSKEKVSADDYNLACIMILPPHQRKGYGRFLIQLSYELTRREGKTGSPEKPLSDLGLVSYRSFWSHTLLAHLKEILAARRIPTVEELSRRTAFTPQDIRDTLQHLGLMRLYRGEQVLNINTKAIEQHWREYNGKRMTVMEADCLEWP